MNKNLKLLIITNNYPPYYDGISIYTNNLVYQLKKNGYNVKLLNFTKSNSKTLVRLSDLFYSKATKNEYYSLFNILNPFNVFKNDIGLRNFVFTNMVYRISKEIIKKYQPDIIHVTYPRIFSSVLSTDIPIVLSTYSEEITKSYPVKNIVKKANTIICISKYVAGLVENIDSYSTKKIRIIPCSINTSIYNKESQSRILKENIIISVARLSKEKNLDTTIKAFAKLPATIKNSFKYYIVGGGIEKDNLQKLISELKLNNKVILLGNISEEEKILLLKKSQYFLLCPRIKNGEQEGFGIVYLEAQAAGLPIITTKVGGIKDAVGNAGLYINDPENSSEIADNLVSLINNKNLCNKLVELGYKRISQFDHKNWIKQIEKVYWDLFLKRNLI